PQSRHRRVGAHVGAGRGDSFRGHAPQQERAMIDGLARDDGAAMLMVVMAIGLIAALSVSLLLTSSSDVMVAAAFRAQRQGFYAADVMIERALIEIAAAPDWDAVAAGAIQSSFDDGPIGARTLDDGIAIDLAEAVNLAACEKKSACTVTDLHA